jgi:hypothetical protein
VSGSSGALALVLNTNSAEDVTSSEAIASIQATSWTGTPTIDAPSVGRVNIVGQIDANISAGSLGPVTAGIIGTSTWTITGAVSNITAGGINALNLVGASIGRVTSRQVINNSSVTTPGNIAAIAAVALSGSTINAGLPTSGSNGVPTGFGASSTISSVVLGHGGFSNSVIAASSLGNVTLGPTASSNGGTPFGVGATQIKSLSVVVDRKLLSVTKVTTQAQVSAAVTKAGITLNDLYIAIV